MHGGLEVAVGWIANLSPLLCILAILGGVVLVILGVVRGLDWGLIVVGGVFAVGGFLFLVFAGCIL